MANGIRSYFLGCPVWGNRDWVGTLFPPGTQPRDFLREYAAVFNTVEGNNTFYGVPKPETLRRWHEAVPNGFRFCLKFPRTITHKHRLRDAGDQTAAFLNAVTPLSDRLGLLFLQLPPSFDSTGLPALRRYLRSLPTTFEYAVEVRHRDFFGRDETEQALNGLLEEHNVNRALFDTGTLHAIRDGEPSIRAAQRKKPRMPERFTATARCPYLRFVGHNSFPPNAARLSEIAAVVAAWVRNGRSPFVFLHAPDDLHAPVLCRRFHQLLAREHRDLDVGGMPAWGGERSSGDAGRDA